MFVGFLLTPLPPRRQIVRNRNGEYQVKGGSSAIS